MRFLKRLVQFGAVLCLLPLIGGYLGAWHPLGDSLAVFRLWFSAAALGCAVVLAVIRDRVLAMLTGAAAFLSAGPILFAMSASASAPIDGALTIYVKNLGSARAEIDPLLADIGESGADVLLFQEVTRENAARLRERLSDHPHWHLCQFSGWSGMAVVSRWPIAETVCTAHRSVAAGVVLTPSGAVWVASVHQVWPYPYDQAVHLPPVLDVVDVDADRRVVAGDFNMVPWGHSVRAIERVSGTSRIGPLQTTIILRNIGLPIDHVLTNGQGSVERRPQFGSDHFGLLARVGFGN